MSTAMGGATEEQHGIASRRDHERERDHVRDCDKDHDHDHDDVPSWLGRSGVGLVTNGQTGSGTRTTQTQNRGPGGASWR